MGWTANMGISTPFLWIDIKVHCYVSDSKFKYKILHLQEWEVLVVDGLVIVVVVFGYDEQWTPAPSDDPHEVG